MSAQKNLGLVGIAFGLLCLFLPVSVAAGPYVAQGFGFYSVGMTVSQSGLAILISLAISGSGFFFSGLCIWVLSNRS
jgi:hypothetical protein